MTSEQQAPAGRDGLRQAVADLIADFYSRHTVSTDLEMADQILARVDQHRRTMPRFRRGPYRD